jgi:hypothetical protein
MKTQFAVLIGAAVITAAAPADAADPATVMGNWIEKLPNGASMLVDLAPNSISFQPVSASGKPAGDAQTAKVTYKALDGDFVAVVFGDGSSGVMIQRKSADAIVLDFPGVGAHQLTRLPTN